MRACADGAGANVNAALAAAPGVAAFPWTIDDDLMSKARDLGALYLAQGAGTPCKRQLLDAIAWCAAGIFGAESRNQFLAGCQQIIGRPLDLDMRAALCQAVAKLERPAGSAYLFQARQRTRHGTNLYSMACARAIRDYIKDPVLLRWTLI